MSENASFGVPETPEEKIARLESLVAQQAAALRAAAGDAPEKPQDLDSQGFPKEYVRLHIFKGSRPDDLSRVPIGIRGYVINVERGKDVIIHKAFADVLKDAIEDVTISGEGGLVTRPAHRFPFQILGTASEAEYKAFHAEMKSGATSAAVRA